MTAKQNAMKKCVVKLSDKASMSLKASNTVPVSAVLVPAVMMAAKPARIFVTTFSFSAQAVAFAP